MVEIQWTGGRTGNDMFQYCFSRLLALKNNLRLMTGWPHQDFLATTPHAPGEMHHEPTVKIIDTYHNHHNRRWLEEDYTKKHVVTNGFFQNAMYYNNKRDVIKNFFILPPITKRPSTDVVIHMRLGDYYEVGPRDRNRKVPVGSVIDPSWHSKILSSIIHHNKNKGQLYIVTDDPKDPILHRFDVYNPIIVSNSPAEDFRFIMNFDTILCGNSSFSWWSTFFSEATKIFTFSRWINDLHNKIIRLADMKGASMQLGTWVKNK